MRFRRYGRTYHLAIESAADLEHVLELDEALWGATCAPRDAFRLDPLFLERLDIDRDGYIEARELKQSVRWLLDTLHDRSGIDRCSTTLRLHAIRADSSHGTAIRKSLSQLAGRSDDTAECEVSLDEIRRTRERLEAETDSEAGIVFPSAAPDPELAQYVTDVLRCLGGAEHSGGRKGVDMGTHEAFRNAAQAYLRWRDRVRDAEEGEAAPIMPLGERTPQAYRVVEGLRGKIDQYFALCKAVALDGRLREHWWPTGGREQVPSPASVEDLDQYLRQHPIAEPRADRVLRFDGPLNPAYEEQLRLFEKLVAGPALGPELRELTEDAWRALQARFELYERWHNDKAGREVEALGDERIREYLGERYDRMVREWIERSRDRALVLEHVRMAEKLALFQGYLLEFANNFVSFPHLYDPNRRAAFEEGSLVMDGRWFNLAVRVPDRAQHLQSTQNSSMFVMYVRVEHGESGQAYEVAVPVTSGTQGSLALGKRGVFYRVDDSEWTAQVVHLVDQPVSLWEAIFMPFQRLGAAVMSKMETLALSADKRLQEAGSAVVGETYQRAVGPATTPVAGAPGGTVGWGGLLAGGGIAVAALASSAAFITRTLAELRWWQIATGVGGIVLAVLIPVALVSVLKLRRRDLSCVLEGSGWAINLRMRLSRAQRRSFTQRPSYPPGSRFSRRLTR